jgi:hypothetical protein
MATQLTQSFLRNTRPGRARLAREAWLQEHSRNSQGREDRREFLHRRRGDSKEALEIAKSEIAMITGQRPIATLSKKSIANFKLGKVRPSVRR